MFRNIELNLYIEYLSVGKGLWSKSFLQERREYLMTSVECDRILSTNNSKVLKTLGQQFVSTIIFNLMYLKVSIEFLFPFFTGFE